MKKFDLIIADFTTPQPYEQQTLEVQALGGTEATVIRVAEGLAEQGARVGVLQHNLGSVLSGRNAFYLPMKLLDQIDTYNFISLRGTHLLNQWPKARKFSWHEDVWDTGMAEQRELFMHYDCTIVAASDWHKQSIQDWICKVDEIHNPRVVRIYNPVMDELFVPKNIDVKYDRNKLCWIASPHKGLKEGIDLFTKLVEVSGNKLFRLYTFNPGYIGHHPELLQNRYLVDNGPVPCKDLWQHVSESLCVWYPTSFEETFGNIAAESNAVHTPLLTHQIAALSETVSSSRQFVPRNDPKALIDTAISWWKGDRPKVWGQDRFRLSNVIRDWTKLLTERQHLFLP